MNRRLGPALTGLLLALPAALGAQEGTIVYTRSVDLDIELPPELAMMGAEIPSAVSQEMLLHFNPSASLMLPAPDGGRVRGERRGSSAFEMVRLMEMAGLLTESRIDGKWARRRSAVTEAYVDLGEGRVVETHEFMGRSFRVVGRRPEYEWRLTGEQAEHLGYMVIKATAKHDGTPVEVWFTPQIPVGAGPGRYGGLPGMILVVSVDRGHTKYFATDIALEDLEEDIVRQPDKGDEMSREDYDRMVEEKTEEMRKRFGGRRRARGGHR